MKFKQVLRGDGRWDIDISPRQSYSHLHRKTALAEARRRELLLRRRLDAGHAPTDEMCDSTRILNERLGLLMRDSSQYCCVY